MNSIIDKKSYVPIYIQLEEILLKRIKEGEFKPGDILPSESEIAKYYDVSRITVRQALARLSFEGLVVRERGRGTFVSNPKISQKVDSIYTFEEEMITKGINLSLILLNYSLISPSLKVKEKLLLGEKENVFMLERLRLVNEEIIGLEKRYFPENIGVKISENDIKSKPIQPLLEEILGNPIVDIKITVSCSTPIGDEARKLEIPINKPVLIRESLYYSYDNKPVMLGMSIFRGDKYQFTFNIRGDKVRFLDDDHGKI